MAHRAENIGQDKLVPPYTSTACWSPGTASGVMTSSNPVSGSASMEMSGSLRQPPLKLFWKEGLCQRTLVPPPAPKMKPNSRGGTTGGFGVGSAIRVSLRPQPVWKFIVLFLFKNKLVPPTAFAWGELAGMETLVKTLGS